MKRLLFISLFFTLFLAFSSRSTAQCSVCTKSVQQLGEKPAKGLNTGILYLMATPFLIVGIIGYRWWKSNKKIEEEESRT